ncbi:MAG TPA: type II toxin-antitoxin system VapC family toxin [Candidatus Coprenecus pullicola]|nr:type II toxin-antitoxin system VapC family toxin [Candidatus Coprenecus pullicola]
MRYLIDTNIIVYIISDPDSLDNDVKAIISDPDNTLYTSAESAKELVIAYRNKGLLTKRWEKAEDMLNSIEDEYGIYIRPINREHIHTYARLSLNTRQDHRDPSDHVIISHAITEHMPLISSDTSFGYYRAQGLDFIYNKR